MLSMSVRCYALYKRKVKFLCDRLQRFALCYRTVVLSVCPICLSVTLVYSGQTVEQIKMKLGMQVGLGYGHSHTALDVDPATSTETGTAACVRIIRVHVYCGQTASWIKMKLGMEVGLGLRQIVSNGDPAPIPKGAQPQIFGHVLAKRMDG